jgi:protein tyrosine phosphatase (PTP) superfamily phosphohydrolase (DUF442 family)
MKTGTGGAEAPPSAATAASPQATAPVGHVGVPDVPAAGMEPVRPGGALERLTAAMLTRVYNWHWVEPGLARSAQMYGGHVRLLLRRHGIRAVVNLRGDNAGSPWYENERRTAAGLGLVHADVALSSKRLPERESLLLALDAVRDAPRPVLIKCSGGADRTGFVAGMALLDRHGAGALERARRQTGFWPFLHRPKRHQRWIRAFFDFYAADAGGRDLRDWIRTGYDAGRFAAFLEACGLAEAWKRD